MYYTINFENFEIFIHICVCIQLCVCVYTVYILPVGNPFSSAPPPFSLPPVPFSTLTSTSPLFFSTQGGIMKCDVIAAGIVNAAKQVGVSVPLIVRLEGTNVEAGKAILAAAAGEVPVITAADLDDAAAKAVAAL